MAAQRGILLVRVSRKWPPPLKRGGCLRGLRVVWLDYRADFQEPAIEKVQLSHRVGFVGQDMPVLVMVRVCLTAAALCDRLVCARHV